MAGASGAGVTGRLGVSDDEHDRAVDAIGPHTVLRVQRWPGGGRWTSIYSNRVAKLGSMTSTTVDVTVEDLLDQLSRLPVASTDAARITQIAGLERLKAAAGAVQAQVTAAFASSQRAASTAAGVPAAEAARSIGAQVALARRDSPVRGSRHVGFADALTREMPHTLAALARGETSEWRATLMVRETAILTRTHRQAVDAAVGPRLADLGDRQTAHEARRVGMRLDPDSARRRAEKAALDRRVTLRPAMDAMSVLTAVLPVTEGVAVYAALCRAADLRTCTTNNDAVPRSRSQLIADTLVHRILHPNTTTTTSSETGNETGSGTGGVVPVEVQLIMTDRTLLDGGTEPAELTGHGPIPATLARDLVATATATGAAFLRRLFTDPTGHLLTADSRRRTFPTGLATFIRTRDQTCRTPWCTAPIRHTDHIHPAAHGGPTALHNGQGLSAHCNYLKQHPGWRSHPQPDGTITTTTPTSHTYQTRPPPLPGTAA